MGSTGVEEELELKEEGKLREKLAVAVKTIQWSYAIFWSISSTQPAAGVLLEWGDGYYNGDIKTRKTVQSMALADDHDDIDEKCLGLQRTQQLRDLFASLSVTTAAAPAVADEAADPRQQESFTTKRTGAALLSPEDLTETEWYFLVCMSFVYCIGQGLPGKSLASNKVIWLTNASSADSKVFDRYLLAKSASIETVVCLPCLGGVLELGVNQKVREDHRIIDYLKASFSEIPVNRSLSKESNPIDIDWEFDSSELDFDDIIANDLTPMVECDEELTRKTPSPTDTSNVPQSFQQAEESFVVEALNVESWKFIEDEVTNGFPTSMSCGDPISQNQTIRDGCHRDSVDYNYQSILSTLFKEDSPLVPGPRSTRCKYQGSDFVSWETRQESCGNDKRVSIDAGTSQTVLKKALYEVAKMHGRCLHESFEENGRELVRLWPPEIDNTNINALTERKRRERISEKFSILGSLVPSTGKTDKVSILDNTIEYLKELEKRVEELESTKEIGEREMTTRKKRRKADRDSLNAMEAENRNQSLSRYSSIDHTITVSVTQKDALIEIRCPCRENLLLNIIESMGNLKLDSHSIESSIADGILSVSIESKLKEGTLESARTIKQALEKIIVED